jgi:maltoporin
MRVVRLALSLSLVALSAHVWAQPVDTAQRPPLPPSAPAVPPDAPVAALPDATTRPTTGFSFGSYGRVGIASDLRGRSGRQANVTAFGSRLDLPPYMEVQFNYDWRLRDTRWRAVVTLAANESLFHFTGRFDGTFAVRNLYVEEQGALLPNLALWVGSRMYRGDDVYLLNWWPLDNLNMVGGGARYELEDRFTFQLAVGMNRLDDPYQLQTVALTPREGFGAVTALLLDRPRFITAAKVTWWLAGRTARRGIKLSLYGEHHFMAEGVRQTSERGERVLLPADTGYVLGAQIGVYSGANFLNVFARWSEGLGAYGDLRVPALRDSVRTASRAQEFNLALSSNWERGPFAIMGGAYLRYFRDADPGVFSRSALWEGAIIARPIVWFGDRAGLALEASYQRVVYNAIDPETGVGAVQGGVFRAGIVPFVSPSGRGSYTRPHLQVMYVISARNEGARRLYAPGDPFGFNAIEHYLGVGAEWWFNSSYL